MTPSAIQSVELLVLTSNPSRSKEGSGWKLRVVQYYKDGKSIAVKLESGEYFQGEDGGSRFKAKGLTLKDLDALEKIDVSTQKSLYLTVKNLMKNPPAPPSDGEKAEAPLGAEEVPFS